MPHRHNAAGGGFPATQTKRHLIRISFLLLLGAPGALASWVQSVEFPWTTFPRSLWERELVWIKNIGITHVSLPHSADPRLAELIHIIRRLNLEADLEGPVPESLQAQTRAHGGPLTDAPKGNPARLSALAPDAVLRSRQILTSPNPVLLWTDVEDTIGPAGYHAGAVNFAGQETPATTALRRDAQLVSYWGRLPGSLQALSGAGPRVPAAGITAEQFVFETGASFVAVVNKTQAAWTGDIKATYPVLKRFIVLPNVNVPANDSVWLPVSLSLMAGPLCKDCTAFATVDHLIYSTAELTAMEYENGILAMEFSAPAAGEVVLQVSKQPTGPLVAGGKPTAFDWDETEKRVRLPIPAGKGAGSHVRIGVVIDAPDETAFFDSARVLMIGETNTLTAQYSSAQIQGRSRLRTKPELRVTQEAAKEPLQLIYRIQTPETAVHGDHAELSIEADGSQLSHVRPELLKPVTLRFTDAVGVLVGANSILTLTPAAVPVNQRTGRDVTIAVRNNAAEIRNFTVELKADGLDFSPSKVDVTIGASAVREVSFRVFAAQASSGVHAGEARVSGAAKGSEAVRFVVIPQNGSVAYESDGLFLLESAARRASFLPGRWLEFINKENGQNAVPPGGISFAAGDPAGSGDGLSIGGKVYRIADLEQMVPKAKK